MLKKILLALILVVATTVTHADPIGISEGGGTPDPGVQYGITDPEEDEVVEEEDNGMKIAASKAYVDTMVETRQDKIPAANQQGVGAGETVMTYTSTGNGEIGERGLYSDISSYDASTDGDKLITASALNDTFTNLPTTDTTKLECANPGTCDLWTIVDQTAYGDFLPEGYTRLAYIESTGTQYIDTGYALTTDNFEIFGTGIKKQNSGIFFGARSTTSPYIGVIESATSYGLIGFWTGSSTWASFSASQNQKYDFKIACHSDLSCVASCTGFADKSFTATQTYVNGSNINLFGNNPFSSSSNIVLYAFSIKDNGILVRNFVPAKNSSNVVGMYDTVTGTFFTNQGKGSFVGPPAN